MLNKQKWPMTKLGDVADLTSTLINSENIDKETTYLGLETFRKGGGLLPIPGFSGIKSSKRIFNEDSILFGRLRPNLQKVARVDFSGVCSTDILPISTTTEIDTSFLYHYLLTPFVLEYVSTHTTGINLPRISERQLRELKVPLPSLKEQKRIAKILDQVSKSIEEVNSQLSKFDELIQAHFHQQFSEEFMITEPLGYVATLIGGKSIVDKHQETKTPYKVLKISAVTSGQFKPGESKNLPADYIPPSEHLVRPGDLLISRANTAELVGATALVPEDVDTNLALPDKIWRFHWKNKESSPVFYRTLLQLPETRAKISRLCSGTGGSMKNIPKAKLLQLEIPKVDPETQQDFEQIVQKIEHTKSLVNNKKLKLIELQASLQTRAFQGLL